MHADASIRSLRDKSSHTARALGEWWGSLDTSSRAAIERVSPFALGAIAGIAAVVASPDHVTDDFFSVTAQIVPVLLLALAIEANVLRSVPRARHGTAFAVRTGSIQRVLEVGTVLLLLAAEVQALAVLQDDSGGSNPTVTNIGLAWGFATIGAIAWRGTGRARPTIDIGVESEDANGIRVRIKIGNVFGDRPIESELNVLVGPNVRAFGSDSVGTLGEELPLPLSAVLIAGERSVPCRFNGVPLQLSPGDSATSYTILQLSEPEALVVVRVDHVELPNGRAELGAWVRPGPSIERFEGPTSGEHT